MIITGKSVKTAGKLRILCGNLEKIRLVFLCKEDNPHLKQKIGFDDGHGIGDAILPAIWGKISYFNINGLEKKRKDLPLEERSITLLTSWEDWHGKKHSGLVTRTRLMYPIEYIPAPSEFIEIISHEGKLYFSTREINLIEDDKVLIHLQNLMLELFGSFEIFDSNSKNILKTKVKKMKWEILPPGKYPWEKVKSIIGENKKYLSEADEQRIIQRVEYLNKFTPTFIGAGKAGFNGYFVYAFEDKELYILESIYLNNATYIFNEDWERLSQLTKNDIIKSSNFHRRIIHDANWKKKITLLMLDK